VTEVELPPEFHQEPLHTFHATQRVDIHEKSMFRIPQGKVASRGSALAKPEELNPTSRAVGACRLTPEPLLRAGVEPFDTPACLLQHWPWACGFWELSFDERIVTEGRTCPRMSGCRILAIQASSRLSRAL